MSSLVSFRKGQTGRKISLELAAKPFPPPPAPRRSPRVGFAAPTPLWHPLLSLYGRKRAVFSAAHQHFEHFAVFSAKNPPPKVAPGAGTLHPVIPGSPPKKKLTERWGKREPCREESQRHTARAELEPVFSHCRPAGGTGTMGRPPGERRGGPGEPPEMPQPPPAAPTHPPLPRHWRSP